MSGFIPKEFIDTLVARADIVSVIHSVVPLKKMGANYKACCPFHDEKSASFNVSAQKQFYHCFGCGASGNVIGFVMRYHHLEFVAAVEKIAGPLGLTVPREQNYEKQRHNYQPVYDCLEKAALYYHSEITNPAIKPYLEKRELSQKIIDDFNIGFAKPGWDNLLKKMGADDESKKNLLRAGLLIKKDDGGFYDRFRERLMFPIRDLRGRVIGFGGRVTDAGGEPKYLNSPETEVFHKGSELYGLYEARKAHHSPKRILIVEGYMDVLAMAQYGIDYAVATLGTATTPQHLELLFRYTTELVFCFDGDQAGQQASVRALKIAMPLIREGLRVKFMFLAPEEDPDSQIRKEGLEAFSRRIETAQSLVDFFIAFLSKQVDLTQVEGRAALVGLARPYIHSISSETFRQLLLSELARVLQMDVRSLQGSLGQPTASPFVPRALPTKEGESLSVVRSALMLLMQYPMLIQKVQGPMPPYSEKLGFRLLNQLINFLRESPYLSTQDILDSWPDKKQAEFLSKIANLTHQIPESGIEAEFLGAIRQVRRLNLEVEISRLLAKAKTPSFSSEERQRLQTLMLEKRG